MPMADHFLGVQKTISWGASKARLVVGAAPLKQSGWDGKGCLKSPLGPLCVHVKGRYLCVWEPGCGRIQGSSSLCVCVCGHVSGQVCEFVGVSTHTSVV